MKKHLSTLLALMLTGVTTASSLPVSAQQNAGDSLNAVINVPGGSQLVSVEVTDENIRTVLRDLASQGNFNLMMDDSVSGTTTLQLSKVSINQALQSIADMNGLIIAKQPGNIFLVITRQAAQDKGISRQLSKVIKIYYSNAARIAGTLNQTIFADPAAAAGGAGGAGAGRIQSDGRTNSIIVVGTQRDIELAEAAVSKMDIPRQSKTFYLSHANALDVATILASSVFNDGTANISLGAATTGGSSVQRSSMRVERQDVQEGSGINNFGGSSGSGSLSQVSLRGYVKAQDSLSVSPEGAMVIPDSRTNSITIMGTAEQIAMAESMIPRLDAQVPQVAIEASLIEISGVGVKQLGPEWGATVNRMLIGFNNNNALGLNTVDPADLSNSARSGISFGNQHPPIGTPKHDFIMELRSLIQQQKAKILANPTIVATHDNESIISIVDEIVRRTTVTLDPAGFATTTVETGEAGIVLDILPKIGEDGTINLRLRPSVTSVRLVTQDSAGNLITLLNRRDIYTQNVRIRDGETLVIGGLVSSEEHGRIDKMPGMGDLPIVGAMFRASQNGTIASPNKKTELVMMITPHIINNTKLTPVNSVETGMLTGGGQ